MTYNPEAGQILVFGAQAIGDPRTHRRAAQLRLAAIHHVQAGRVIADVGVGGTNDAEIVDLAPDLREDLADFQPALPVLLEAVRRTHQVAGGAVGLDLRTR